MTEQVCIIEKRNLYEAISNLFYKFLSRVSLHISSISSVLSSELGNSYIASVKTASRKNAIEPLIYILALYQR
jgi:hypothetical protein